MGVRTRGVRMVGVRIVAVRNVAVRRVVVDGNVRVVVVHGIVRMVVVHGIVRMVVVRRIVVVRAKEFAAAACAHAERRGAGGTFGVGVGSSDGCGLDEQGCAELSHRAAQLEEDQHLLDGLARFCTVL